MVKIVYSKKNDELLKGVKCERVTHRYCGHKVLTISGQGPETPTNWLKPAKARLSQVQHKPSRRFSKVYKKQEDRLKAMKELLQGVAIKFHIVKNSNRITIDTSRDDYSKEFVTSIEHGAMQRVGTLRTFYKWVRKGTIGLDPTGPAHPVRPARRARRAATH